MQNHVITLESPVSESFRCTKAANSLDIDAKKKSVHRFEVNADIETDFNIALIVGASGSGKTSLARKLWGDGCFTSLLREDTPVIDQFDEGLSYDDCAGFLSGVGLTSVPCWIRPAYTLSNGQKARAEIALQMARADQSIIVIDEWTSVVDRTVAKVMSHCIQKHARRTGKKIVLLSCHYDVIDWVNPDWIIDCNKQSYTDRRELRRHFERDEQIQFDIKRIDRKSWNYFSKYHYLSDRLPGGHIELFGLFHGAEQIGFQCFANYVPHRAGFEPEQMHSNRTVIHPDYAGFGLGMRLIDETSKIMTHDGYDVRAKYSSTPIYRSMKKNPLWKQVDQKMQTTITLGANMIRGTGHRLDVKCYCFKFIG